MQTAIRETNFRLPNQTNFYRGKVRDVYTIDDRYLVIVATDRISAFDVVLPRAIPYKGQVLNQIAETFLRATQRSRSELSSECSRSQCEHWIKM